MDDPNHHIARCEYKQHDTSGWQVRIQWDGEMYNKFFADSKMGGKRKAMLAAREYRDELCKKLGRPLVSAPLIARQGPKDLGVYKENGYYVARPVLLHGKAQRFSIKQYTDDGAFWRALHARRQMEKELEGKEQS